MKSTAKNRSDPRQIAVQWLDQAARPLRLNVRNHRAQFRMGPFSLLRDASPRCARRFRAFTLLEMMVVVGIIGFIAALALPRVTGYNRANSVNAALRQLQDDTALARQLAIKNRATVLMVFVPPGFYNDLALNGVGDQTVQQTPQLQQQITNLLVHQYVSYALLSLRTVGDQPGQHFPHYLTDWRTLPQGVFIAPFQFTSNSPPLRINVPTTNTLSGTAAGNTVYQFNWATVPFPSIAYGASIPMPYIGFTPQGTLTFQTNQYIMLARGSIFYPQDTNGVYQGQAPQLVETPPGNETNNPCMIQLDWLTARGAIVQNQFQ